MQWCAWLSPPTGDPASRVRTSGRPCGVAATRVAKTRRALLRARAVPLDPARDLWGRLPLSLVRVGGGAEAGRLSVSQREPLWVLPGLGCVA